MTLSALRKVAKKVTTSPLKGCVEFSPSILVRCTKEVPRNASRKPGITVGEFFHVEQFDVDGQNPNHVRFPERAYWWPAENFEIISK